MKVRLCYEPNIEFLLYHYNVFANDLSEMDEYG